MIQVTVAQLVGFVSLVAVVVPGVYMLGRISKQVDVNTGNIGRIFEQIKEIHSYVKNGRA